MNTILLLGFQRQYIRDIDTLLFTENAVTKSRRGEQFKELEPLNLRTKRVDEVICRNSGYDGQSVIWKCTAPHLESDYKLSNTRVVCEGWDGPNDDYIVSGSCYLKYKTYRSTSGSWNSYHDNALIDVVPYLAHTFLTMMAVLLISVFCIVVACRCCKRYHPVVVEEVVRRGCCCWPFCCQNRYGYVEDPPVVVHPRMPNRYYYDEEEPAYFPRCHLPKYQYRQTVFVPPVVLPPTPHVHNIYVESTPVYDRDGRRRRDYEEEGQNKESYARTNVR